MYTAKTKISHVFSNVISDNTDKNVTLTRSLKHYTKPIKHELNLPVCIDKFTPDNPLLISPRQYSKTTNCRHDNWGAVHMLMRLPTFSTFM